MWIKQIVLVKRKTVFDTVIVKNAESIMLNQKGKDLLRVIGNV